MVLVGQKDSISERMNDLRLAFGGTGKRKHLPRVYRTVYFFHGEKIHSYL